MIVVGTTLAAFVMDDPDSWGAWLYGAEDLRAGWTGGVEFFAAIEVDARGLAPFGPLLDRLSELGGHHWTFQLDDGRTTVTTENRLRHLAFGENMASDFATATGASHLLFMAADCQPPPDALPKLVEVDYPIVGGHVSTYGLNGPESHHHPQCRTLAQPCDIFECNCTWFKADVRAHMPTAAFVLLQRNFFKTIKWRYDPDLGLSDDPAMYHDAQHILHLDPPAVVRHDVVGRHFPDCIGPIETRGHDMAVHR